MLELLKYLNRHLLFFLYKINIFFTSKNKFKKYEQDVLFFVNCIRNKKNFAFSRFSDGEIYMLKNKQLSISEDICIVDNKVFGKAKYTKEEIKEFIPHKHEFYHKELLKCVLHEQKFYFKGISCSCCNGSNDVNFMRKFIKNNDYITFSNLIFNGNYKFFLNFAENEFKNRDIVFVMSKYANPEKLPFKCRKIFYVGENCMINDYGLINQMHQYIKTNNIKNYIFLFSSGTLSNFLIYYLYKSFPNNTYLDIGSFFNPHLNMQGWKVSRGYLQEYWLNKKPKYFLNRKCFWND